jgi:alkanesulfonate monooxygenase SsuD/methylene tetrahydromethanopterin reductase-like flavin-dependent oxidoreductase (luciferase family)
MKTSEMLQQLETLKPLFADKFFDITHSTEFTNRSSITVKYANTGEDTQLARLNATPNLMITITDRNPSARNESAWSVALDAEIPAKVWAYQFTGRGIKFRSVSGTPERVTARVVAWFRDNVDALRTSLAGRVAARYLAAELSIISFVRCLYRSPLLHS